MSAQFSVILIKKFMTDGQTTAKENILKKKNGLLGFHRKPKLYLIKKNMFHQLPRLSNWTKLL